MNINLETARYYSGLGDLVSWAWLLAPAIAQGVPLVLHRQRDLELMTMLGVTIGDQPGGMNFYDWWNVPKELRCTLVMLLPKMSATKLCKSSWAR